MQRVGQTATQPSPVGNVPGKTASTVYHSSETPQDPMANNSLAPAGGSQPHENCQPFLCINFIISLFGVFPQQT